MESDRAISAHPLGVGPLIVPDDEGSEAFVRGLVDTGAAVKLAAGNALPPGATHLIVGQCKNGLPILQRARLSLI